MCSRELGNAVRQLGNGNSVVVNYLERLKGG
jgi:hypothetical protein